MGTLVLTGATSGSTTLQPTDATTQTITLPANSGTVVTTASTGAVTQNMLAAGVAGNGPAFSAYQSVQQTGVANGVWTKIQFQTKEYDTANCFDNVSNYRFTPNVAGYYQINALVAFTTLTSYAITLSVYKNGSSVKNGITGFASSSSYARSNISVEIYFNGVSDYIEVYAYQGSGANASIQPGSVDSYFQGSLVRAA